LEFQTFGVYLYISTLFSSLNQNVFQIWRKQPGASPLPQNSSLPPPESRAQPSLAAKPRQSSGVGHAPNLCSAYILRSPQFSLRIWDSLSRLTPGIFYWFPPRFPGEVCKFFTLSLNFSDLDYGSHHIS